MANKGIGVGICTSHGEYFLDAEDSPCPSCEDGVPMEEAATKNNHEIIQDMLDERNWLHVWTHNDTEANWMLECWTRNGAVLIIQIFERDTGRPSIHIYNDTAPRTFEKIGPWLDELIEDRRENGSHHDVTHSMLTDWWRDDRQDEVIENLRYRHPAVTAGWLVQGLHDKVLNLSQCNEITNRLMDDLLKLRDTVGLDPSKWPPPREP